MTAPDPMAVVAEVLTEALGNCMDDFRGTMPGGWDDFDGLSRVLSDVLAADPRIAIVPREDLFADQADEIAVLKQDLADAYAIIAAPRMAVVTWDSHEYFHTEMGNACVAFAQARDATLLRILTAGGES